MATARILRFQPRLGGADLKFGAPRAGDTKAGGIAVPLRRVLTEREIAHRRRMLEYLLRPR